MVNAHIFFLQLNEINFDYIDEYIRLGYLPTFKSLFEKHGYVETTFRNRASSGESMNSVAHSTYWHVVC